MTVFQKHSVARWGVPAAALALVAGGAVIGSAQADGGLPPKTAEELLVALQQSKVETFSGTVNTKVDLGLGGLPLSTSRGTDFQDLANGSNTLRVWADGPDRQRVALLGQAGEADVIRNGSSVWTWNAEQNTASFATLPDQKADAAHGKGKAAGSTAEGMPTPQEAAEHALEHLDPTTEVTTSGVSQVAGRDSYALTLTPRSEKTLVERVVIDIDGQTSAPLRVRVLSTASDDAAVDVGFTDFSTETPAASTFAFTPPAGATVKKADDANSADAKKKAAEKKAAHEKAAQKKAGKKATPAAVHVGDGWSRVAVTQVPADALNALAKDKAAGTDSSGAESSAPESSAAQNAAGLPAELLGALPTRSGAWGSGKVFEGTLFTAVLTDDGRLAVGAVPASELEAALATPAAKALAAK